VALSHFDLGGAAAARLISRSLGAALLATALLVVFRRSLTAYCDARFGAPDPRRTVLLTIAGGALLGVLVSISSVGAGAVRSAGGVPVTAPTLRPREIVDRDIADPVPFNPCARYLHAFPRCSRARRAPDPCR
jgi:hypothetical protein